MPFVFSAYALVAQTNDNSSARKQAPKQHFACNVGYTPSECQVATTVLRKALAQYPADALGEWTWVLVRTQDWKQILSDRKFDTNHPAFSYLPKRETFLDGALVVRASIRGAELSAIWHTPIEDLLDLAIRHELAHALCNDPDETKADRAAIALKNGTPLSCQVIEQASTANHNSFSSLTAGEWPKLLRQAQGGNHKAQTRVGLAYRDGEIVKQDFSQAIKWFSEAAMNDPVAEYHLGAMYYFGQGVVRNPALAAQWFEKGASRGVIEAQYDAAWLYETGQGIQQNLGRAFALYREAANSGYAPAENNLGHMYDIGEGVARNSIEAMNWYMKSAIQGYPPGQFNVALMYCKGIGVPRDYRKAAEWLERVAKQGHTKAESALGDLYLGGWGVHQDDHLAAFWLEEAASQGDPTAQTKLGMLYLNGRGVAHDDALGAMWLSKAAEQGHHDAQGKLALLYEKGRGVPYNLNRAYIWQLLSVDGSSSKQELRDLARYMTDDDVADAERHASEWLSVHQRKLQQDAELFLELVH